MTNDYTHHMDNAILNDEEQALYTRLYELLGRIPDHFLSTGYKGTGEAPVLVDITKKRRTFTEWRKRKKPAEPYEYLVESRRIRRIVEGRENFGFIFAVTVDGYLLIRSRLTFNRFKLEGAETPLRIDWVDMKLIRFETRYVPHIIYALEDLLGLS